MQRKERSAERGERGLLQKPRAASRFLSAEPVKSAKFGSLYSLHLLQFWRLGSKDQEGLAARQCS